MATDLEGLWELKPGDRFKGSVDWNALAAGDRVYIKAKEIDLSSTYVKIQFSNDGTVTKYESPTRRVLESYELGPVFNGVFQELTVGNDTWVIFKITPELFGVLSLRPDSEDISEIFSKAEPFMLLKKIVR